MSGARLGCEERHAVQPCELRGPSSQGHPLRPIRRIVDEALGVLSPEFEQLYAKFGRPSIPPETASCAAVAGVLFGALGAAVDGATRLQFAVPLVCRAVADAAVWDATVFTKNRERLIEGDIARKFMAAVLNQGSVKALLSDDHFSTER
jgi:hypothetical protein